MNLKDIGYSSDLNKYVEDNRLDRSDIARVIIVYKDRYLIRTDSAEIFANLTGNFQHISENKSDFPVVGDWVHIIKHDQNMVIITMVLPRFNCLERQASGKSSHNQLIAANIDYGLIVEAVANNFNLNRIERFLIICKSANVLPIIILTKIDLISSIELNTIIESIKTRISNVTIFAISNSTLEGIEELKSMLEAGKTYCLLGLSGVGKSTLINNFTAKNKMKTKAISQSTNKGVHTTSHRQLFLLNNGSIVIDNPGMREIGLTGAEQSVDQTIDQIIELAFDCHFSDCTHTHEKECAVLSAIKNGDLDQALYQNYIKMKKEELHAQATKVEKRRQDKSFGKMLKNHKKNIKLKKQ